MPPNSQHDAETIPQRTTPTWEMEVLLSGATVFALFQLYSEINVGIFWLLERLPDDRLGMLTTLSSYVQGGVLGLALGFFAHLVLRAVWVSLVGIRSVDPSGQLRHNPNFGPAQQALIGEAWDALPNRIARLDDAATLVFALAIGLAKMMALLALVAGVVLTIAFTAGALLGLERTPNLAVFLLFGLLLVPLMIATFADNRAGRKGQPSPRWAAAVIRAYGPLGFAADRNLGLMMATYRLAGSKRSWRGNVLIGMFTSGIIVIVLVAPILQNRGIGGLLDGDFPRVEDGSIGAMRADHYLDRLPEGAALRRPIIAKEVATGPLLRLFIPYVPHWHDAPSAQCKKTGQKLPAKAQRDYSSVLACLAATQPVRVDGKPVQAAWMYGDDARRGHRGFVVMIDLRALPQGAHVLEIEQPEAARNANKEDHDGAWRIPFWT